MRRTQSTLEGGETWHKPVKTDSLKKLEKAGRLMFLCNIEKVFHLPNTDCSPV